LLGFDFMLSSAGDAYFLEINARATPACTLQTAASADLLGALFRATTARPPQRRRAIPSNVVALFPNEIGRDEKSPYLRIAHHDVPADEPALVAFGLRSVGRVAEEFDRARDTLWSGRAENRSPRGAPLLLRESSEHAPDMIRRE
jgi:hypothetical protein